MTSPTTSATTPGDADAGHGHDPGHAPATSAPSSPEQRRVDALMPHVFRRSLAVVLTCAVFAGLLAATFYRGAPARLFSSYLVAFAFGLTVTSGALFFVILQHLVRAGWSVAVRRLAEGISLNMPLMMVLFIPVAVGIKLGYLHPLPGVGEHADVAAVGAAEHGAHAFSHAKEVWLHYAFLIGRIYGYMILCWLLATWYFRKSVEQDRTGEAAITTRLAFWSSPLMIVYAVTTTLCAFDLLMALDPHWFSTIFGVCFFAGSLVAFFSFVVLLAWGLQRQGRVPEITPEHYHDLGKLLFAFVVFWAYVSFSQFMLIWYGNLPEETGWFVRRTDGTWYLLSLWIVVGHFVIPFFCLLSRFPKRRPHLLIFGSMWMLFVHYTDLFWIVLPEMRGAHEGQVPVPLLDAAMGLSMTALLFAFSANNLRGVSLIPERDPRLHMSLAHENY